jgi:hypothetical protein
MLAVVAEELIKVELLEQEVLVVVVMVELLVQILQVVDLMELQIEVVVVVDLLHFNQEELTQQLVETAVVE